MRSECDEAVFLSVSLRVQPVGLSCRSGGVFKIGASPFWVVPWVDYRFIVCSEAVPGLLGQGIRPIGRFIDC